MKENPARDLGAGEPSRREEMRPEGGRLQWHFVISRISLPLLALRRELFREVDYVEQNAVRAGLVSRVEDWPYRGVIHDLRFLWSRRALASESEWPARMTVDEGDWLSPSGPREGQLQSGASNRPDLHGRLHSGGSMVFARTLGYKERSDMVSALITLQNDRAAIDQQRGKLHRSHRFLVKEMRGRMNTDRQGRAVEEFCIRV